MRPFMAFVVGAGIFLAINCLFYDIPNAKGT
jgi:hypothetical protein